MIEDAVVDRVHILPGEASYRAVFRQPGKVQEETQDFPTRCEVTDDSVVVLKSRPVKAGNRLEDKTGMTCGLQSIVLACHRCDCICSQGLWKRPKASAVAKG